MSREITCCRVCRGENLAVLLELGEQALTGIFPRSAAEPVQSGPLTLVRCARCRLVQLLHSYEPSELYGANYGYRSGLNRSMVEHLRAKVGWLRERITLLPGDIVVDIGSNDGTTLGFYPAGEFTLMGFDPTGGKFRRFYREDVGLVEDFFSARAFRAKFGSDARARLITSLAMFYDLEDPLDFMREIVSILADDGLWHFEQSYLPSMLETNSYDTICHEHLEYYAVQQIQYMCERAGLKIVDVQLNDVNGGSFAVTVAKTGAPVTANAAAVDRLRSRETAMGLDGEAPFAAFRARVRRHRETLVETLSRWRDAGKTVLGYGASTKGNVVLQYCRLDTTLLPCIAEVNEDKFGSFTPGTRIPIVSEAEAKSRRPDAFLVLPWHFRQNLLQREQAFLRAGGTMIFPLPEIDEVRG